MWFFYIIMKKINVVKKNSDFTKIIKSNHIVKNKYFVIYYLNNELKKSRFGISVSKKIGNAVTRNYYKRIIRGICDKNLDFHDECDYIIIMRKDASNLNYNDYQDNLVRLFKECKEKN